MLSKPMAGALGLALVGNLALGWLWQNAREDAQAASAEAQQLESNLRAVAESEKRSRELSEALSESLNGWQAAREAVDAELAETRRTLTEIRAAAREETDDASLACAVRPVPDDVDRLLQHADPDDGVRGGRPERSRDG